MNEEKITISEVLAYIIAILIMGAFLVFVFKSGQWYQVALQEAPKTTAVTPIPFDR